MGAGNVKQTDIVFADKALAPFVTAQAAAVWEAISTCWSAQVYIPELGHRFWKFHLQVGSHSFGH